MEKKYIFLLFLSIALLSSHAQSNRKIDSLTLLLAQPISDDKKVDVLNKLAWELKSSNPDTAYKYSLEAQRLASKNNNQLGLSYAQNNIALYFKSKGEYDSAEWYYQKSLDIRLKLNDTLNIGRSYINLLNINKAKGNISKAIDFGRKAEILFNRLNNNIEKATVLNNLGPLYIQQGDYENALTCYLTSLELRKKLRDSIGIANVYLNLGNYYDIIGNNNKALKYFKDAEPIFKQKNAYQELAKTYNNIGNIYYNLNNRNDAYLYYIKSVELKEAHGFTDDLTGTYINLGVIEAHFGHYDNAKRLLSNALADYTSAGNTVKIAEINLLLAEVLLNQKKYNEAKLYISIAQTIADSLNTPVLFVDIYKHLSLYYKGVKDFSKAIYFSDRSNELKDSLESNIYRSQEVYTGYLEEKKKNLELEQELLLQNAATQKAQDNAKIIGIAAAALFILTSATAIFFFLLNKNKKLRLTAMEAEKEVSMHKQILDDLISEQEEKSINALLEGQETERKRIAQELHDRLGSLLTSVKFYFKSIDDDIEKIKHKSQNQLNILNQLLDEALEEVRRISNDLASGILINFGLPEALKELSHTIENAGNLKVNLYIYGVNSRLDYKLEINLYRIVQELLTNCLKHSGATEITVQIISNQKKLTLMVEDNGVGFNIEEAAAKTGMGLSNIQKRVDTIRGTLTIDSGKSNGTTTTIDIDL